MKIPKHQGSALGERIILVVILVEQLHVLEVVLCDLLGAKLLTSDAEILGGLLQPISTNTFPYLTSTMSRVIKPDFEGKTWTVVSNYASPQALGGAAPAEAAEDGAGNAEAEGEAAE